MARRLVLFATLFFLALATGGAFVVYLAYNPAGLTPTFYVANMQHGIHVMLPLAVALNLGLVCTIVSTALARGDRRTFWLFVAASVCIVASVLVTVLGNWPINNQIITWDINAPPSGWTALKDAWWRFHVERFLMLVVALSLVIVAALSGREVSQ